MYVRTARSRQPVVVTCSVPHRDHPVILRLYVSEYIYISDMLKRSFELVLPIGDMWCTEIWCHKLKQQSGPSYKELGYKSCQPECIWCLQA